MNAGRQQSRASILDVSDEDFDATMKTNIYAPFWIIRAALPHLKPGSTIVATTSEQAYDPSPDLYDYAQTKAATMNYVKPLGNTPPPSFSVHRVAPGPIWTPLQISGGATMEKVEIRRPRHSLAGLDSPRSSPRSMSSSRPRKGATRPVRCTGPRAERGSREADRARASRGRAATCAPDAASSSRRSQRQNPSGAVDRGGMPMPADGFHGKVRIEEESRTMARKGRRRWSKR